MQIKLMFLTTLRKAGPIFLLALLLLHSFSCNRTAQGTAIGAAAGALVGVLIADGDDNAKGILIGATVGGIAGAIIGSYMDKHAKKLKQDLGKSAEVERVGESILVTFDSGIMFDVDSYALKASTKANLDKMAETMKEYDKTEIIVMGHTDATGSDEYNQKLSENRAASVSRFLQQNGITAKRVTTKGFGEQKPVASNNTASGREQNRRVEIAIVASKALVESAKADAKNK
ncbi:MAG: OmpA family protein [Haliscomenobacter sp.]|uniref:OmpA family protein n=1 Tax=Haliscomenobacter sp. TaxID=2717303 RepID=UPI0029A7F96E|nr:OmpA family protein [Haliscomenobacter sp.]MDX2071979.1 OmpA family protein [Haliscomenobacter sp.]